MNWILDAKCLIKKEAISYISFDDAKNIVNIHFIGSAFPLQINASDVKNHEHNKKFYHEICGFAYPQEEKK